jgi:hypothetical protein
MLFVGYQRIADGRVFRVITGRHGEVLTAEGAEDAEEMRPCFSVCRSLDERWTRRGEARREGLFDKVDQERASILGGRQDGLTSLLGALLSRKAGQAGLPDRENARISGFLESEDACSEGD